MLTLSHDNTRNFVAVVAGPSKLARGVKGVAVTFHWLVTVPFPISLVRKSKSIFPLYRVYDPLVKSPSLSITFFFVFIGYFLAHYL